MNKFLLSVMFLACVFLAVSCAAAVPVDNPAQANASVKDPNQWDFGTIKAGATAAHEFTLTNNSGKDLAIKDISTSCGCTVSEIQKKLLKPAESTVVTVKFNSKGYSGDTQQFVYVNTDSPETPIIRFIVKAHVASLQNK
jgi:hypothetical protein